MRGSPLCVDALEARHWGLSPRVRGSLHDDERCPIRHGGSIPACAGEPMRALTTKARCRVYPRVCGGATSRWWRNVRGLSPRVRGSLLRTGPQFVDSLRVYPRVCGGAAFLQRHSKDVGVYPRVCGGAWALALEWLGSIPACAGEPLCSLSSRIGSIPACAGEPNYGEQSHRCRVYPRVCGGASDPTEYRKGVYPRVCGGALVVCSVTGIGSIPACAGEPRERA